MPKNKSKVKFASQQQLTNAVNQLKSAFKKKRNQKIALGTAKAVGMALAPRTTAALAGSLEKYRRLFGHGDYGAKSNVEYNTLIKGGGVGFESTFNTGKRGVRVCNREYVGDLVSAGAGFAIMMNHIAQPGLAGSFPWLSNSAAAYETYRFHGLVYEYVSTSTNYAATSALGVVVMAAQHRADASGFTSRMAIENSEHCVSARPDRNILYGVECVMSAQNEYFVRSGATSTPTITEDFSKLTVATSGITAPLGTSLGELWVTYDVELFNPKIPNVVGGYANIYCSVSNNANPLGTSNQGIEVGASYLVNVESAARKITFGASGGAIGVGQVGMVYDVHIYWNGTSAVVLAMTNPVLADCTVMPVDERVGTIYYTPVSGTSSTRASYSGRVTVTGANPSMTWPTTMILPNNVTNCQIIVSPIGAYGPYRYDSVI